MPTMGYWLDSLIPNSATTTSAKLCSQGGMSQTEVWQHDRMLDGTSLAACETLNWIWSGDIGLQGTQRSNTRLHQFLGPIVLWIPFRYFQPRKIFNKPAKVGSHVFQMHQPVKSNFSSGLRLIEPICSRTIKATSIHHQHEVYTNVTVPATSEPR